MAVFLQPIYTQTLGSAFGNATFNNIPQTFTDLVIKISTRDTSTSGVANGLLGISFNGDNSANNLYSDTILRGTGSAAEATRNSNQQFLNIGILANTSYTANTFCNTEIYIPNYTGSNSKSFTVDFVNENNATANYIQLVSGLYRSSSPITSLAIYDYGGAYQFAQYSTFSIYGVLRQGV